MLIIQLFKGSSKVHSSATIDTTAQSRPVCTSMLYLNDKRPTLPGFEFRATTGVNEPSGLASLRYWHDVGLMLARRRQ